MLPVSMWLHRGNAVIHVVDKSEIVEQTLGSSKPAVIVVRSVCSTVVPDFINQQILKLFPGEVTAFVEKRDDREYSRLPRGIKNRFVPLARQHPLEEVDGIVDLVVNQGSGFP